MSKPKWTLMIVPHDRQGVKTVHLSGRSIRAILSLLLLVLLLGGTFAISFVTTQSQHLRTSRIERENELLAAEMDEMRGQMQNLTASLDTLSQKNSKYRVIAGLTALDADVERVGIGGPGTATLETAALYRASPAVGEKVFSASYDLGTLLRRANLLGESMDEALETMEDNVDRLAATPSIAPSDGHLSSLFSTRRRHPVLRITRPHEGIDIAAPVGKPILAPAKGTIRFAGTRSGGYGKVVEIDHGYGYLTRFAHTSRILVRNGQKVERGQTIAEVGATGLVSGPHLHYEVEVDGKPVDPLDFIIADAIPD